MIYTFWAFISVFQLIYLTAQDYMNKMMVDERKNYYMMGLTTSLYFLLERDFAYIFIMLIYLIALFFIYRFINKRYPLLGEADVQTYSWLIMGIGAVSMIHILYFILISSILTLIFVAARRLAKRKEETQYYPIILISFILFIILFGYLKAH